MQRTKDERREANYEINASPNKVDVSMMNLEDCAPDEVEGCSIPFMLLLCAPRMAMNMSWAAQWAALGPLLQILVPSPWVLAISIIGPTSGLLVAPTIGVLSDNCTSKYGRRRPFLFWGAITSVLCWVVMMNASDIGVALGDTPETRTWTTVFVVSSYIWMDITVNITQVPTQLIIADMAGSRQVTAASIGQAYSIAGGFVVSGYIWIFGPAHESIKSFMGMLIAIMLITTMSVCCFVKERPLQAHRTSHLNDVSKRKEILRAFAAVFTGLKLLPQTLVVYCIIMVFVQYGYTAYNAAKGQFFGLVVKGGNANGADLCGASIDGCTQDQIAYNEGVQLAGGLTDTLFSICGLLFLLSLPFLVRTFGSRKTMIVSLVPQTFLMLLAFSKNDIVNVLIVILCSITQNTIFTLVTPAIIHVVGHADDNNLGLFAGAFNSCNCLGQFLNFIFSSILVTSSMGYALPVLVGGILSAIGFVVALVKLDLNMKTM
jgi:solute carrier family 45 protein 1/2/4